MKKYIINIEGCDGVGKSSIARILESKLKERFPTAKVYNTHYPLYDSTSGEYIKDLLYGKLYGDVKHLDPYKMAVPYIYNRLEHLDRVIKPNMDDTVDEFYIFDRSYISNLFYSGVNLVPITMNKIISEIKNLKFDISNRPLTLSVVLFKNSYDVDDILTEIIAFRDFVDFEYRCEIQNSGFYDLEDTKILNFYLTFQDKSLIGKSLDTRDTPKDTYEDNNDFLLRIDSMTNIMEKNSIINMIPEDYRDYFSLDIVYVDYEPDINFVVASINHNADILLEKILKSL